MPEPDDHHLFIPSTGVIFLLLFSHIERFAFGFSIPISERFCVPVLFIVKCNNQVQMGYDVADDLLVGWKRRKARRADNINNNNIEATK